MAMMDNTSLHLQQPTGILRSSDRAIFQLVRWNAPENPQNFTFQLLVINYIDALQFMLQDTKQIEACDCQVR
jgi:hypothetical protein